MFSNHGSYYSVFSHYYQITVSLDAALLSQLKCACSFLAVFSPRSPNPFIHTILQIEFAHDGTCHGFAIWIDWVLDKENSIVISTGPGKDDAHPCGAV
jgi:hypothetical protein